MSASVAKPLYRRLADGSVALNPQLTALLGPEVLAMLQRLSSLDRQGRIKLLELVSARLLDECPREPIDQQALTLANASPANRLPT